MPTVLEAIEKMQVKVLAEKNPSDIALAQVAHEKAIVPYLVEGARIKLKTDNSYYQTVSGYDLASGELCTDEISKQHTRTRYGAVIGKPSLPNADFGVYHGCITVPVVLDGNMYAKVIDINGVELVNPRKMVA